MSNAERIRYLAASALGVPVQSIRGIERIEHGLTNENWIARGPRESVVVRLNSPKANELGIERHHEAKVLEMATQAGVGPRVLKYDFDEDALITELLPGSPWSIEYARSHTGIARLAELMREVHALPIYDGIKRVDALAVIERYWATLEQPGQLTLAGSTEQRATARILGLRLREEVRPRLCHNDVHHLNLMDDGRVRLLDWEYAGLGDPFFDLAGICCYHEYDEDQCEALLQHYLGREDAAGSVRLNAARWMFDYIRDLWIAVRNLEQHGVESVPSPDASASTSDVQGCTNAAGAWMRRSGARNRER